MPEMERTSQRSSRATGAQNTAAPATFTPAVAIYHNYVLTLRKSKAELAQLWSGKRTSSDGVAELLGSDHVASIDPFDRVQLQFVVEVCRRSASLSEAGRTLFAASRAQRTSTNDSDRLRKYLAKFKLEWADLAK